MCFSAPVFAQAVANGSIGVTVTVSAKAKLTLGAASVTFADADPETVPSLSSGAITIDVKARTTTNGAVTLTVLAGGDLTSGSDTIAITNLTWSVAGSGFVAGANDKTTAQTVGSWTGSGTPSGTHTLALPNNWTYATGSYVATLNYTLTAP
ncbi:MAG: hypothetical protein A3H96_17250 [Acidobacteria bacterium RIFCSPLOWO2_02_FULL_67_36]|nr:MAG: hypothetical protein A3H96_17250 [Acidobacteria bacterium RIFCSPLOWO2_02_FULL_67_36]OFW25762.1 MAG: hypothetical protein A3G21_25135 [Acidobacteria bacterium RIFCSPLOWO2_12_FULL_66_21]